MCFCTYPLFARVEINKKIKAILKQGGYLSITFYYRNPSRRVQINTAQDVQGQFVVPSGLMIRRNSTLYNEPKNHLFMKK